MSLSNIGLMKRPLMSNKIFKFTISGGINTFVSFLSFVLMTVAGVNYLIASALGYSTAVLSSYWLNKRWTFNSDKSTTVTLMSQFVLINLLSLGANLLVLFVMFDQFGWHLYLSQVIATFVNLIVNFVGYRVIFK